MDFSGFDDNDLCGDDDLWDGDLILDGGIEWLDD